MQLDARRRLEESWGSVREYLVALLDWAGAGTVEAEELAVIPGLDEVFALADIKAFADSGDYDLVVVDCAPTAETLRLLSLPDVLGWYMQRVFPAQRNVTRAIRPLLARVVNMPLAGDGVFDAVREFYARLDGVRELLTDGSVTSARLVVNAERMVVAEARRTYTYLSLFGYHVDAVDREPVAAGRGRRSVVQGLEGDPGRAARRDRGRVRAGAGAHRGPRRRGAARHRAARRVRDDGLRRRATRRTASRDVEPFRVEPRATRSCSRCTCRSPRSTRSSSAGTTASCWSRSVRTGGRSCCPDSLRRREVGGARLDGDRLVVEFVEV